MRDLSDKALDECISRALKTEITVTYEQRQRAWAALQQKLPTTYTAPVEMTASFVMTDPLHLLHRFILSVVASLFADETIYQRARSAPRPSHRRYSSFYREFSPAG